MLIGAAKDKIKIKIFKYLFVFVDNIFSCIGRAKWGG